VSCRRFRRWLRSEPSLERYTEKRGRHLAYIYYYTKLNGRAPSEADMQRHFRVTPPAVYQREDLPDL
jgi:hypothetical protein